MEQGQIQVQKQEMALKQTQAITQQQLLQAQLVELPLGQLIERVNTEMNDNPALEENPSGEDPVTMGADADNPDEDLEGNDNFEAQNEREERQSALDEALASIGRDDEELPVYGPRENYADGKEEEMVYGNVLSFYDQLQQQVIEAPLTERQKVIMDYLIGSLDNDGLLRKSNEAISDELAVYHNIDVTPEEIEDVVRCLHDFDPAGIGARTLQECLMLQVERRDPSELTSLMMKVIGHYYDDFVRKRWDRIVTALHLNREQASILFAELRRLNPKPGASMGEAMEQSMQQITPDFIVESQDDGTVTFSLNQEELPELRVSQSFADTLEEYNNHKEGMSRQMKEALLYTRQKVEAARGFIEAVNTRKRTLATTMKAIINWQHRYFEEGDESLLRPMILKDIAAVTGLDMSTISRVCNSKYAQTRWGIFPLRHFFSDGYTTEDGEELSTREMKVVLRDLIDHEDKRSPLTDDALKELMKEKGFPIARRTVAKYREQMGLPVARMRKIL